MKNFFLLYNAQNTDGGRTGSGREQKGNTEKGRQAGGLNWSVHAPTCYLGFFPCYLLLEESSPATWDIVVSIWYNVSIGEYFGKHFSEYLYKSCSNG